MSSLLRSFSWHVSQSQGCCGLFEIYRLKASYETEKERDARTKALMDAGIAQGAKVQKSEALHKLLRSMTEAEYGWSVPIEWGFAAVLDKLDRNTPPNLFFMSDNLDEDGDVHTGAFSTKNFVAWLKEMDVGALHETPPQKSHRGGAHPLQVWVWHPDWDKVREVTSHCMTLALDYYKEIESVEEKIIEARKDRNRKYLNCFAEAAGWE